MALVLTRKSGESVRIGDDVTVTVYRADNGQLRLRIDAPKDVRVLRAELHEERSEAGK